MYRLILNRGVGVLISSLICYHAYAQDFEKIKPKPVESNLEKPKIETQDSTSVTSEKENKIVLEKLKGLVFVEDIKQIKADGIKDIDGILAENLPELQSDWFKKEMDAFLGKSFGLHESQLIISEVAKFYKKYNGSIVAVLIPDQNISNGVIQLIVLKGKVGDINISGNRWAPAKDIKEEMRLRKGEPVSHEVLRGNIDWLNRNPFQKVDAVFAPGKMMGLTDVNFRVRDRFPGRFYTGYDDTGNDLTGDERWYGGVNWGNAFFQQNHLLSYQFTTSSDFDMSRSHAVTYSAPLPWRHLISLFGSRTDTESDVRAPLELTGQSWNVGVRYVIPLDKIRFEDEIIYLEHELNIGFDFKQSNSNLEFGGTPVTNTLTDINQWTTDYAVTLHDPYGSTSFMGSVFYSPGEWSDNSKDTKYQAARAFAEAEYAYGKIMLSRNTVLPWDFSTYQSFTWQISNGNLLASEQLGFGGRHTIRGYDEREVSADEGWLIRQELRTPPVSIAQLFDAKDIFDQLIFLGFWDYGVAKNNRLLAGERVDVELSSVGPGVRYAITPYFSVRADYGFQLINTGNNNRYASRWHLGVLFSY